MKVKSITSGTKFNKLPTPTIFTNSKTPRSITTPKFGRGDEKKKTRFNQQSLIKDTVKKPAAGGIVQKERAKWKKQLPVQKEEVAPPKRTPREIREAYTFRRDDSKHRSKDRTDKKEHKKLERTLDVTKSPIKEVVKETPRTRRDPTRRQNGVSTKVTPRTKSTDSNSSSSISVNGKGLNKSTEKLSKLPKKNVTKVAPIAVGVAGGVVGGALAGVAVNKKSKSSSQESVDDKEGKEVGSATVSESGNLSDRSNKSKSSETTETSNAVNVEKVDEGEAELDVESISGSVVSNAVVGTTLSEDLEGPGEEDATEVGASEIEHDEVKVEKEGQEDEEKALETIPEDTKEAKSAELVVNEESANLEEAKDENKDGASEGHEEKSPEKETENDLELKVKENAVTDTEIPKDAELVDETVKDILVTADKHEEEVKEVLLSDGTQVEETPAQPDIENKDISEIQADETNDSEKLVEKEEEKEEEPLTVDGKPMTIPEDELCTVVDSEAEKVNTETAEDEKQTEETADSKKFEYAAGFVEEQLRILNEMGREEENKEDTSENKEDGAQEADLTSNQDKIDANTEQDKLKDNETIEDAQKEEISETAADPVDNKEVIKNDETDLHVSLSAPELITSNHDDDEEANDASLVTIAKTPSAEFSHEDALLLEQDTPIKHSETKVDDDGPLSIEDVSKYLKEDKLKSDDENNSSDANLLSASTETDRPTTSKVFGGDVEPTVPHEEALGLHIPAPVETETLSDDSATAAIKIQSAWRGHQTRKHVIKQVTVQ